MSLRGMGGPYGERWGCEMVCVVLLFFKIALSESKEVTLVRGRIEPLLQGQEDDKSGSMSTPYLYEARDAGINSEMNTSADKLKDAQILSA